MNKQKNSLLSARDLCKNFNENNNEKEWILNHIELDIFKGDFTIIMGSSGAGKSTLLYALSGMDPISYGNVFYKDQKINTMSEKKLAVLRAREFGFVFQQTQLVSNLTLLENVEVAGYLNRDRDTKTVRERAAHLLEQMHVKSAVNRLPAEVSGGEAQRAALARAVINEPELIFADEPTGALNKKNTEEVLDLLTNLNAAGQSILMVTHDVRAALRGNRLLYLEDGVIIGEQNFPPYSESDPKERETRIQTWLASLEW